MAKVTPNILARFLDDRAPDHPMLVDDDRQYSIYADELRALIEIIQSIPPPPMVSFDAGTNSGLRARLICDLAEAERPSRRPWLTRLAWPFAGPMRIACSSVPPRFDAPSGPT